ncbi:hypothetical protein HPP92_018318 [Vanilla planifolia]|uniref:Leucine-rich repeat-containing N-terminal plant-type domain-containing protein n=1 Tax=Vanilla planifolia TaxID=51239 RepID=A0A835QE61_VANPL|nr:hypothetical protein HPP92_018943 [Vanilla planifolia]KAG0468990.1 hypothetical protein HPP92_018318 [Vanilla planifolia]
MALLSWLCSLLVSHFHVSMLFGLAFTSPIRNGSTSDEQVILSFKSLISYDPQGALASWDNRSLHFCLWKGPGRVTSTVMHQPGGCPKGNGRLRSIHKSEPAHLSFTCPRCCHTFAVMYTMTVVDSIRVFGPATGAGKATLRFGTAENEDWGCGGTRRGRGAELKFLEGFPLILPECLASAN